MGNFSSTVSPYIKLLSSKAIYSFGTSMPVLLILFSYVFPDNQLDISKSKFIVLLILPCIIWFCIPMSSFVSIFIDASGRITAKCGPLHYLNLLYFLFYCFWATKIIYSKYNASDGIERVKCKYFFTGLLLTLIVGVFCNVILLSFNINSLVYIGPFSSLFLVGFTAYAILKYQLMDIRIAINRLAIFVIVYTIVLGVPVYIGISGYWILSLILMLLLASAGPFAYGQLKTKTEAHLFLKQRAHHKLILETARKIQSKDNIDSTVKTITNSVVSAIQPEFTSVFLKDGPRYLLKSFDGEFGVDKDSILLEDSADINNIRKENRVLVYHDSPSLKRIFLNKSIGMICPFIVRDKLYGFMVIGNSKEGAVYTDGDINILDLLSSQTALILYQKDVENLVKKHQEIYKKQINNEMQIRKILSGVNQKLNYSIDLTELLQLGIQGYLNKHETAIESNAPLEKIFMFSMIKLETLRNELDGMLKQFNEV
jgi:hypothetical protein